MDRPEELKAKARDYERKEQPEHALEVYLSLVAEASLNGQGGLWAHIGELQERIGAVPNAVESYSHAITAFSEAGQLNNAIAISQRILRLAPENATAHLRLGEISLSRGLRKYARVGIGSYARLTAATDQPGDALEPLAAFLARFPDDAELWKEWEGELLALGKGSEVTDLLGRLRDSLAANGHTDAVERISRELAGMEATNGRAAAEEEVESSAEPESGAPLPLLDTSGVDDGTLTVQVAPIEGLEPTGGEAFDLDEADTAGELPLLDTLPELTTDRIDDDAHPPSEPLAGMERFEFAGSSLSSDTPDAEPVFDPATIAEDLLGYAGIDVALSDAASHYDLGLAYKEMDRFDESLANLAMAIRGGHDPATVMEVAAEILVKKGEFGLADDLLRRIPGVGDHAIPEHLGVHYWLARASEESGRRDDARHALELVVSVDPDFRDASERLRNLV